jgi:hypothetical protein
LTFLRPESHVFTIKLETRPQALLALPAASHGERNTSETYEKTIKLELFISDFSRRHLKDIAR